MLDLVSDWDRWVHRRVDGLRFAGEDETVLERRHSMDFTLPPDAARGTRELLGDTAMLVPVTFMNKWRLPHLSIRDEVGRALPLVERRTHIRISAAMLTSLAYQLVTGALGPTRDGDRIPPDLAWELCAIAAEDPSIAISMCAYLVEPASMLSADQREHSVSWRHRLAVDSTFMELAFELAHGFPLLVLCPSGPEAQRVVKVSYDWPLAHPLGLSVVARMRSIPRRLRLSTDPQRWSDKQTNSSGTLVVSAVCPTLNVEARASDTGLPCVSVKLKRRWKLPVYRRMRPNVSVSMAHAPAGEYTVALQAMPGFTLLAPASPPTVRVHPGETTRITVHARQDDVITKPELTRSGPTRPASLLHLVARGVALRSKPLMIRLRLGDGGARHFEFEAPPGIQVTRAKLVADRSGDSERDSRELDLVLESRQRSHLYAPADGTASESGYAFLNLRPRVETIVRSAVLTAILTALPMIGFAISWLLGAPPNVNPGALVLGIPVVLSAYFAQSVPSRVTQAMLYGVRITALLPALLGAVAAALLLLGHDDAGPAVVKVQTQPPVVQHPVKPAAAKDPTVTSSTVVLQPQTKDHHLIDADLARTLFLIPTTFAIFVAGLLGLVQWCATRPPEQAWTDGAQGEGHRARYLRRHSTRVHGASVVPLQQHLAGITVEEQAVLIRDQVLDRSNGLSRQTRELLLGRRQRHVRVPFTDRRYRLRLPFIHPEVPPALYFDAAETVPIYRGLPSTILKDAIRSQLAGRAGRWRHAANNYDVLVSPHRRYEQQWW